MRRIGGFAGIVLCVVLTACDPDVTTPDVRPIPERADIAHPSFADFSVEAWAVRGGYETSKGWRITVDAEVHNRSDQEVTPVCYLRFGSEASLLYFTATPPLLAPRDWMNVTGVGYFDERPRGDSDGVFCRAVRSDEVWPS